MEKRETLASRLTEEERSLLRTIGSYLSRMMQGKPVEPLNTERRDELGLLANMAAHAAQIIASGRERDQQHSRELAKRLAQLEEANATQAKLLNTIRELSLPILRIHPDILLLPIIGELDSARAEHIMSSLLSRIGATRSRVVILDVTCVSSIDGSVAELLQRTTAAVALLGAKALLCGVTPAVAQAATDLGIELTSMSPARDLETALRIALGLIGERLTIAPSRE